MKERTDIMNNSGDAAEQVAHCCEHITAIVKSKNKFIKRWYSYILFIT